MIIDPKCLMNVKGPKNQAGFIEVNAWGATF